jgi:hypothetical protein
MTGKTWKAKTKPCSPGRAAPKRNWIPSLEEFMTAWTPLDTACKTRLPASQYRTMTPKATWIASAPSTVRGLIARRFVESRNARKRIKTIPPMPHKICCISLPPWSHPLGILSGPDASSYRYRGKSPVSSSSVEGRP